MTARVARAGAAMILLGALALPSVMRSQASDPNSELPAAYVRRATKKASGKFFTAADLVKMGGGDVPQLLARISGGTLKDVGGGEVAIVGRRGPRNQLASAENELCRVGISVNENRVPDGFDLRSIKFEGIIAVEAYSGPSTIPPELNGTGNDASQCGLVVVWLKGR